MICIQCQVGGNFTAKAKKKEAAGGRERKHLRTLAKMAHERCISPNTCTCAHRVDR